MSPDWRAVVAATQSPYKRADLISPLLRQATDASERGALFDALLDAIEDGLAALKAKYPRQELPAFVPSRMSLTVALDHHDDPWAAGF